MLIYNVTLKIEWDISADWVEWMKKEHIPQVMDSGCFVRFQFIRILQIDDTEGPTYAVQYHAASNEDYELYLQEFAPVLREHTTKRWGTQIIAFRSIMQLVH